jgi:hypothetical protein
LLVETSVPLVHETITGLQPQSHFHLGTPYILHYITSYALLHTRLPAPAKVILWECLKHLCCRLVYGCLRKTESGFCGQTVQFVEERKMLSKEHVWECFVFQLQTDRQIDILPVCVITTQTHGLDAKVTHGFTDFLCPVLSYMFCAAWIYSFVCHLILWHVFSVGGCPDVDGSAVTVGCNGSSGVSHKHLL